MDTEPHPLDVVAPDKIAQLDEAVGIRKVALAFLPTLTLGMLHKTGAIDPWSLLANLVPVTAGNIVGGGVLVALVYWLVYLRPSHHAGAS
jgi:hypothetical protein